MRPFDCSYYIHKHQCGFEHNDLEKCTYAIEEDPSFFLHDPELNKKLIAEGQKALQVLKLRTTFVDGRTRIPLQEEMEEQKIKVIDMNTNHEFPKHIVEVLEALKFEKKELRYYGKGQNYPNDAIIEFGIDGDSLMCKDVTNMKPLFIVKANIGLGYFIVLLQAYYIIHGRYIYERVDAIKEEFQERFEDLT